MKKTLLTSIICLLVFAQSQAQTLIHYWDFNNFSGAYHNPNIPALKADYSIIDTNKTSLVYARVTNASSTYAGYVDAYPTIVADSDVYNLRAINGTPVVAGSSYRLRNPADSAYLLFYMPSTGYKNLKFSYSVEASSVASGIHTNNFSYSTDSGATWKTVGLDHLSDSTISLNVTPQCVFKLITVTFTTADTTVNNNAKLVFKITPSGNTSLTSGNDRFDNFALDGTAITTGGGTGGSGTTPALVHYWNFNNLTTAYHNPNIPALKADYSVLDTNITSLQYKLVPGTSSSYLGYVDNYPVLPTDLDTNNRAINGVATPSGNSYRFRNPVDSAYLVFYIPSINYKNLVFSYAVMASSFTSGALRNNYAYSLDSGATWKTTGLSQTYDTTTLQFSLKTIQITDTAAYNNPRLAFKITPSLNGTATSGTSGNNRFDNVTLDGVIMDTSFHYHSHVSVPNVAANNYTLTVYPNPASSSVTIATGAATEKTIIVYDIAGKMVYMKTANTQNVNIAVGTFAPGMYHVLVHENTTGENYITKFVKN